MSFLENLLYDSSPFSIIFNLILLPGLATSRDAWYFAVPRQTKSWGADHIISLGHPKWPTQNTISPKDVSIFAKTFNFTLAIRSTEKIAIIILNNETGILNDLEIIKWLKAHLEFIKPSIFISLHKTDYCKFQCGCQPHSFFTRTKAKFQKLQLFGHLNLSRFIRIFDV